MRCVEIQYLETCHCLTWPDISVAGVVMLTGGFTQLTFKPCMPVVRHVLASGS
jgi:hypothetical protein